MTPRECIGVDLDNTIVCYDSVFAEAAHAMGLVDGSARPLAKHGVKSLVESMHGAPAWTELQGEIYGARMQDAQPFPGVMQFFRECRANGISTCIISHKTRFPALGPRHDLRQAALDWLESGSWFDSDDLGLDRSSVEFHDSLEDKLAAIARRGCTAFVDDLPLVLLSPSFPSGTQRVLFDPAMTHAVPSDVERLPTWDLITARLLREGPARPVSATTPGVTQ